MRADQLILLLALCGNVFAGQTDCKVQGIASQANSQDQDYFYCTEADGRNPSAVELPAQLTLTIETFPGEEGQEVGDCMLLESDLTDDELYTQLGLRVRPSLKYSFDNSSGAWEILLDQFGDVNCTYLQRRVRSAWQEDTCPDSTTESQGFAHEMYFDDDNCGGFGALTDAERENVAVNDFSDVQDPSDPDSFLFSKSSLFDPWGNFSIFTGMSYTTESGVVSMSVTSPAVFNAQETLCYGIGDGFKPPYHIPVMYQEGGVHKFRQAIHAPYPPNPTPENPSFLCGYDCTADIATAHALAANYTANTSQPYSNAYHLSQTTCGMLYGLNLGQNDTLLPLGVDAVFGMNPTNWVVANLILFFSQEKTCNECNSDDQFLRLPSATHPTGQPWNFVPSIGHVFLGQIVNASATEQAVWGSFRAGSSYQYCQVGAKLASSVWYDPEVSASDVNNADPNLCGTTSGTGIASGVFAVAVSLLALLW